jgi:hypothetical protein
MPGRFGGATKDLVAKRNLHLILQFVLACAGSCKNSEQKNMLIIG